MPAPISRRPIRGPGTTGSCARFSRAVLPYPSRFRFALGAAMLAKPLKGADRRAAAAGQPAAGDDRSGARAGSRPLALRSARHLQGPWRAPRPGRHPVRLRPAGAQARLQRGGHPAPQPPRRRGGAAEGGGVLRRPRPSHGPRRGGSRLRQAQHRRLDRRDGRGGARRHRHHRVGLRHDDQGLRLHVPGRSGLCREGRPRLGDRQGHHRIRHLP